MVYKVSSFAKMSLPRIGARIRALLRGPVGTGARSDGQICRGGSLQRDFLWSRYAASHLGGLGHAGRGQVTDGRVCVDVARLIGGEEVMGGLLVSMAPTCWLCLLRPRWLRKLPVLSGAGFDKYKNLLLTFQPGSR